MQRLFFATADDLLPIFEAVERKHRLMYTLCGLFASNQVASASSGASIPTLRSPAPHESAIACPQYLVTAAGCQVAIREVRQDRGGVRYAIDQLTNSDSIVFQPGGLYPPNILLNGRAGSVSDSPFSTQVYRAFTSAIGKAFQRVNAFYVGPQAYELWRQGHRLTQAVQSPPEYDLAS